MAEYQVLTKAYHYQGAETDPAEEAARNLDWDAFLDEHSPRHRIVIEALLEGCTMRVAGQRCGLKDSAALVLKRRIAADLTEFFGAIVVVLTKQAEEPVLERPLRELIEQR